MTIDDEHDPAGHSEHFLRRLDRFDQPSTKLALVMYRSHGAVAAVLERLPAVRGTQRVAFALTHDREPPYVLVTHEGRFVTCLAAGMQPTGCYVVTFAQFEETLRRLRTDDQRARAWNERSARGPQSPLLRLVLSDGWIAREDISAILAVRPSVERDVVLCWVDMIETAIKHARDLAAIEKTVHRARVGDAELRRFWRCFVAVGNLGVIASVAPSKLLDAVWREASSEGVFASWEMAMLSGHPYLCLQVLNTVARGGRSLLPMYKRAMAAAQSTGDVVEAASALVAIGARHESLSAEVRKVLASDGPPDSAGHPWRQKNRRWLDKLWEVSAETVDARRAVLAKLGADVVTANVAAANARGEFDKSALDEPIDREDLIAQMSAVGTGFIEHDGSYRDTKRLISSMAGWAGQANVEDFYPDERWAKLAPRPRPREMIWALAEAIGTSKSKTPVRVEEKPGRNDPCSCGSGKKYKKCCGG